MLCLFYITLNLNVSNLFHNIDILTLSETHLDDTVSDGEIGIDGLNCIRRDRNRSGGSVLVYIRDNIHFTVKPEFMPNELEIIVLEIHENKQKPYLLVNWYRPPSSKSQVFSVI